MVFIRVAIASVLLCIIGGLSYMQYKAYVGPQEIVYGPEGEIVVDTTSASAPAASTPVGEAEPVSPKLSKGMKLTTTVTSRAGGNKTIVVEQKPIESEPVEPEPVGVLARTKMFFGYEAEDNGAQNGTTAGANDPLQGASNPGQADSGDGSTEAMPKRTLKSALSE